jgi:hypothetical protein
MTHFTVGIIVPGDKLPSLHEFVARQMAPYDESIETEPYVCYSIEHARADIEREIRRLEQIIRHQEPGYDLERCRDGIARLQATAPEERYREYINRHDRFNGRGEPISTCNPASKWDWYRVGGRWDGWITGNERSSENGFNFGPDHEAVANNIATTGQALERGITPHAIVTPDGAWHERSKLGWWATLITENENWETEARDLLARYPGPHLLILDAHI